MHSRILGSTWAGASSTKVNFAEGAKIDETVQLVAVTDKETSEIKATTYIISLQDLKLSSFLSPAPYRQYNLYCLSRFAKAFNYKRHTPWYAVYNCVLCSSDLPLIKSLIGPQVCWAVRYSQRSTRHTRLQPLRS